MICLFLGIIFGNVVSFATSGAICDSLGWEWTFYIPCR